MRHPLRTSPCALLVALALAGGVSAATVHVDAGAGSDSNGGASWPEAVATIQRAVELATATPESDVIRVAAGTYGESVAIGVSGISLLGGHPSGGGTRDPTANVTTIDPGGIGPAVVVSGENGAVALDDVTIDGFTLTGGSAYVRDAVAGGAGVFVEESAVVITNNVIAGNASTVAGAKGGGLYLFRQLAGGSTITANRFEGNTVIDGLGGAAWLVDFGNAATQGPLRFAGNEVVANSATATTALDLDPGVDDELSGNGGGVFAWGGAIRIEDNRFEGNVAEEIGGARFNGQGGALFLLGGEPSVTGNVIEGNEARAGSAAYAGAGGGAYVLSAGGSFDANEVRSNRSVGGDGESQAWGGGMNVALFDAVAPTLTNNVFEDNEAVGYGSRAARGGGLYVIVAPGFGASASVERTTLRRNRAAAGAGGAWLFADAGDPLIVSEIDAFENEADFASGVLLLGTMELEHGRFRANRVFDPDGDAVSEIDDTCRGLANPVQADADGDGQGDACDDDDDGDGVLDVDDNCPLVDNADQADGDGDGTGDACEGDRDGDGIDDAIDNCPGVANPDQGDATMDGVGDLCEPATFDALETNASGLWIAGDSQVANVEIVENVGQGLQVVGFPEDGMNPLDPASPVISNATIADNLAAGVITYLAEGTVFRDSIIALNVLSDRFDTEDPATGQRSSPNMTCDHVNMGDGFGGPDPQDVFCEGTGNISALPRFVTGPTGNHYLEQLAAGGTRDSSSVDAGSRPVAGTVVAGRTTRVDEVPDEGTIDLGWHAAPPPPPGSVDELEGALRVAASPSGVGLTLSGAPTGVAAVRVFRGELDRLPMEPTHASPFSGQAGDPECSWAADAPFVDAGALDDGRNWYYLAAAVDGGRLGGLGADSFGVLRTRPEDSAADAVVDACP